MFAVVEDIAPAPSVFRAEQAHVDVCIASAPAVTYTASAPMDDGIGSALAVILTPALRKKRQPARLPKKQRRANTSAEVDGVRDGNRLLRAVYKFRAPAAWAAFPCVVCAREAQRARHVRGDLVSALRDPHWASWRPRWGIVGLPIHCRRTFTRWRKV